MSEWLQGRRRTAAIENVACRLREDEVEEASGNSAKQLPTSKKKKPLTALLGAEINSSNSLPWECTGSKVHGKAVRACLLLLVMMARENISAGGSETCVVEAVGGDCAGSDIEALERAARIL